PHSQQSHRALDTLRSRCNRKDCGGKPLACTLLIGLESSDVTGPLALFQATKPTRKGLLQLVKTLNNALGKDAVKEAQVEQVFDLVWPKLEESLAKLPSDKASERPLRPEDEMIREILDTVRSSSQRDAALMNRLVTLVEKLASPKLSPRPLSRLSALIDPDPDKIPTDVLKIVGG